MKWELMAAREAEANAHRRPAHLYLLKAKGVNRSHASLKTKGSLLAQESVVRQFPSSSGHEVSRLHSDGSCDETCGSVSGFPRITFCRLLGRSWHFLKAKNTSVSSFVPGSCLPATSATAFFLL